MVKIEHNQKPHGQKRGLQRKWPFGDMKPGDSFFFEGVTVTSVANSFGNFLRVGRYSIQKEGKGYRFFLIK